MSLTILSGLETKKEFLRLQAGELFFIMDFSLLTTSGVSQKRNGAVGNTKPPAMRVEDKLL